jgi:L-amino acid N-acyltransferase YncA
MPLRARPAVAADAAAIAAIYNEGIAGRTATFVTDPAPPETIERWIEGDHPVVVVTDGEEVLGYASASPYRPGRPFYAGIAEFSVYVAAAARRRGAGRVALQALEEAWVARGGWKLVSRVFPENAPSLALMRAAGFREVGVYERHGKLDGEWRDCVIVEKLIGEGASTIRR